MSASNEDSDQNSILSDEECTPHDDEKQRNQNSDNGRRATAGQLSLKTVSQKKMNPTKLTNKQVKENCKKQMAVFQEHKKTQHFVLAFLAVHNRKICTHWEKHMTT